MIKPKSRWTSLSSEDHYNHYFSSVVVLVVTSYSLCLCLQVHDKIYPKQILTPKEIDFNDSKDFNESAGYGFYEIDGEGYYFNEIYG